MCERCKELKHDILILNKQLSDETLKRFEAEQKAEDLKVLLGKRMDE